MLKLEGKTALITGGGSGIGLAVAQRFAKEGAQVFITGRRQAQLDSAVALIGARAVAVQGDVTNAADLSRLFDVVRAAGKLDILVTSSGVSDYAPLDATTGAHLDKTFDLNVRGMVLTVAGALPLMDSGGDLVRPAQPLERNA